MSNININDITWGPPPEPSPPGGKPGANRGSALRDFAAVLRLQPGRWAKYPKLTKAGYSSATFRDMGMPDIECTTRRVYTSPTEYKVATYARCVLTNPTVTADEQANA
jgi:hypothetical protein